MKIIDLAEIQKNNGTLPKHIRYENEDLYFDGVTYYDKEGNNDLLDILATNNNALTHLYDKVEVVEEEKKIPEKLNLDKDELLKKVIITAQDYVIEGKINEIIDYLKSKGE